MDTGSMLTIGGAIVIGGLALGGAAALSDPINEQRGDLQLSLADIEQTLPPDAALMQAFLGTFRGLAVNVLWQRAEFLKQEGKFYEAMQLADWITTLQPRYPKVWEFTSWNNSYNISVMTHTPEERWQWVNQGGIDQLRDKGIYYNPNALALYQQTAWIFLHKIGRFQDDFNQYYKQQLAKEWDSLLGGGPPESEDMDDYRAWFSPIVEAPETLEGLYEAHPGTRRLVGDLRRRGYTINDDEVEFRFLADFAHEYGDFHPADESEPHYHREEADDSDEGIGTLKYARWPEWASVEDREALMAFARKKVIEGSPYRMKPERMLAAAEYMGPIDWRHQAAHALYWSLLGLEQGDAYYGAGKAPGLINAYRMLFMSAQQLQRSGDIRYDPQTGYTNQMPDDGYALAYLRQYDRFVESMVAAGQARELAEMSADQRYGAGFRNNMDQVISNLYLLGDEEQAQSLYDDMGRRFADSEYSDRYDDSLERYVALHLTENLENPSQALEAISYLLQQAILVGYGEGEGARAQRFLTQAVQTYDWFKREYPDSTVAQEVPPFDQLVQNVSANILVSQPGATDPRVKIAVWENLPVETRQAIWPVVYPSLRRESEVIGYDFATAYPAPPGSPDVPEAPEQPIDPNAPRIERQ